MYNDQELARCLAAKKKEGKRKMIWNIESYALCCYNAKKGIEKFGLAKWFNVDPVPKNMEI